MVFFFSPPLLSSFEERLGGLLKVLLSFLLIYFLQVRLLSPRFLLGGYCMHWSSFRAAYSLGATDCVSGFPPSLTTFLRWSGWALATCWRRTSERTLSVGSLHALVFCFTRFHKVLGWSSCLALSNQQACVRPCCFTGRPRPLGTGFFNGSMVLSLDLLLPPLRFLTYGFLATGSPRLTASLSSSVTGKAPC